MTRSIYDPDLFERYIAKKKQQLKDYQKSLRRLPAHRPDRARVKEAVNYLSRGITELQSEYKRRKLTAPKRTKADAIYEQLTSARHSVDQLTSQVSALVEEIRTSAKPSVSQMDGGVPLDTVTTHRPPLAESWDKVCIAVLSDERIQIHIPGREPDTRNYAEFGLADGRNGKQNRAWSMLIALAKQNGFINACGETEEREWAQVERRIQELRIVLRKHFGIVSDPIPWIEKSQDRRSGYRALFIIKVSPSYET